MVLWYIFHHKMLPVEAVPSHDPKEAFLLLQPEGKFPCLRCTLESVELAGEEDTRNNFPPHIPLYNLVDQDDDDDFLECHPFVVLHNRVVAVPDRNHPSCIFLLVVLLEEEGGYDVFLVRDHNHRTDVLNLIVQVDGGFPLLLLSVGAVHHCSGAALLVLLLLKIWAPSQLWFPLWNPPSPLGVSGPRCCLLPFGYDLQNQMI